jgi:fatty-acyl-CoA synthase
MNLSDLIDRNAAFAPDKPALRFEGEVCTYDEFSCRIEALAGAMQLQLGVRFGDRLGVLALNSPDYLTLLYACARLGAVLVPLNWRLAVPEQMFILHDAAIKALFVAEAFGAICEPLRKTLPQAVVIGMDHQPGRGHFLADLIAAGSANVRVSRIDWPTPVLIVYTAGTTGRPKGAVLTQEALLWNGVMSQHMHAMTASDHILTVLPFFHVGGLNIQTTPALHAGATVTIHARFTPADTLYAIGKDRPTLTVLVPATIQALVDHDSWHDTDLSCLRAVTTGSTLVPQSVMDAVTTRGVPVLQVYGSTETCPIAVYTRMGGDLSRVGSTGLPGLLCDARVVDESGQDVAPEVFGEVLVRGPNLLVEYWQNATATAGALRDGWFWTGDIARRDRDGYFYIHDRKQNMIVSGGENIYPAEIERVLLEHGGVVEAAVIGAADPRWQEVPVAFVVMRAGAVVTSEDLRALLLSQLARFKVPRDIVFVNELPRNALGKVQHFRLRQDWYAR